MTVRYFTVTNGPADPDEPGWRLDLGAGEGTITFTPTIFRTPVEPENP